MSQELRILLWKAVEDLQLCGRNVFGSDDRFHSRVRWRGGLGGKRL